MADPWRLFGQFQQAQPAGPAVRTVRSVSSTGGTAPGGDDYRYWTTSSEDRGRDFVEKAVADRVLTERVAEHGAPGLERYRRGHASIELSWPGDEKIRCLCPATDTTLSE
jgi:hypothetical protein